jgi:DNA topoisomerase-1
VFLQVRFYEGIGSKPMTGASAVAGLARSDPRGPGISRIPRDSADRREGAYYYVSPAGAEITDAQTLARINALVIPPGWQSVWISPDPLGHIQATGVDSRGRTQYRYHELWREQRDAQKFEHMLLFAGALPTLRTATEHDLAHHDLDRGRVAASAVRLIDLGLFRLGSERYAELDHHYGAATLEKRHVRIHRDGIEFDYLGKEGKRRAITVTDRAVLSTVRALGHSDTGLDSLFSWQDSRSDGAAWHPLHSHDISAYIADNAGAHFTAKEFRTWNATVLMALVLANTAPPTTPRAARRVIVTSVGEVAAWLGDTPAVARASYIDPRLISHYEEDGKLASIPALPPELPASVEAEIAVADLLASARPEPQGLTRTPR